MNKLRVGLYGASGRMGQEITKVISEGSHCELFYPISKGDKWNAKKAAKVDVWIDFSSPDALEMVLKRAAESKTPVVCGTTGFAKRERDLLKEFSKKIPLLWSSNMSLGVAVLTEALKSFSAVSHFDFQVEEIHHKHKKDKPSGTAITLQENLIGVVKKKVPEPLSIRGGGVYGVHKIYALSEEEVLTFEHTALNRTVFAKGAVRAAEWLQGKKKAGLYQLRDVLFVAGK